MKLRRPERYLLACAIAGLGLVSVTASADDQDGLYVNGAAGIGRPLAIGVNHLGLASSLSGGYKFANGLRPELELSYRPNNKDGFSEHAAALMGNLWYEWWQDGYYFYLGGGFGGVRLRESFGGTSASDTQAAWQAGLGFGHSLTRHLILGVDYRHLASFDKPRFTVNGLSGEGPYYQSNAAMIELRYTFGAGLSGGRVSRQEAPVRVVPLQ